MWWKNHQESPPPPLPPYPQTTTNEHKRQLKRARRCGGDCSDSSNYTNTNTNAFTHDVAVISPTKTPKPFDTPFICGSGGYLPKPHQRAVVQHILTHVKKSTDSVLVQHSTGSGKSLSIAWLVMSLLDSTTSTSTGDRFDLVIVLNDRRVLDNQLGSIVEQFLDRNECSLMFHRPRSGPELQSILTNHVTRSLDSEQLNVTPLKPPPQRRVIVSTLQKFASVGLDELQQAFAARTGRGLRVAVVADEAHRSHGKTATSHMFAMFGGTQSADMEIRSPPGVFLVGFTATPHHRALRLFGTRRSKAVGGGKRDYFVPAHVYSMRQAVSEKMIKNVLSSL